MTKSISETYIEPPEIDYEKIRQAGDKATQAIANFANKKLSQYTSPGFRVGSISGGVKSILKELLRNRIVNIALGTGQTRINRIEKLKNFIAKQLEENPGMTQKSIIADIISKMVKKEWSDIFGSESEEIIPPSDDQLKKKKKVLVEPPVDDSVNEIDNIQASDIQMSDGSDVPDGPYRMTGRDPNKTHINLEYRKMRSISETLQALYEQNPDDTDQEVDPSVGQAQGTTDPNMMAGDYPNAMGMGTDQGMGMGMGMPGQETPQTADEIGRIFELKKIYRRLLAIETYLSFSSDPELTEISSYISKAIDFFELLSSNLPQFNDKIDGIIIVFYEFLKTIYDYLKEYYEKREQKNKID